MTACLICHHALTDPRSLARGMGPICYAKHGAQGDLFLPGAPVYDFSLREVNEQSVLCIVDLYDEKNPTVTVTNGAELVLKQIADQIGSLPERIIYRDSEGEWDQLKAKSDGSFKGFAPLPNSAGRRITEEHEALQCFQDSKVG
ncbi:DUF6011 domain-containing protein [Microbulbifer sp. 2201CG32-9]|uniref:DUF6011 domain-containing protein n=1 Tax=Microbulbifer sp. 2201CG32-9 TaxID=3232309 RepID=UPI00345B7C32